MFRSIPQNLNLVEFKKLCVWLIGEHLTFTQCCHVIIGSKLNSVP